MPSNATKLVIMSSQKVLTAGLYIEDKCSLATVQRKLTFFMRNNPADKHAVRVPSEGGMVDCTVGGANESANNRG